MAQDERRAPFPWFGGKSKAATAVWSALGDVLHYIEPFCGSMAALLNRPHIANRPYFSETVNDADCLLANAWRSIQLSPDAAAEAASYPVSEIDLTARHITLVKWRGECRERMGGDPEWHDPRMAGWWLWGVCSWIGREWCSGNGPWTSVDGLLVKQPPKRAGREPGVSAQLPHVSNGGMGVTAPQMREPGVNAQLPHLSDNGGGVNHAGLREPGIGEPHPMTMPKLRQWFALLSARLRHVRILCGDWTRAVTTGAGWTLSVRQGKGPCGVFLDPPYADTAGREGGLYGVDSLTVAHDVRRWCLANGDNPKWRIVLACFEGEHGDEMSRAGWREIEWYKRGFLSGGMANVAKVRGEDAQKRERLWASPHCLHGGEANAVQAVRADSDLFSEMD